MKTSEPAAQLDFEISLAVDVIQFFCACPGVEVAGAEERAAEGRGLARIKMPVEGGRKGGSGSHGFGSPETLGLR
jgi:hypothetical protein